MGDAPQAAARLSATCELALRVGYSLQVGARRAVRSLEPGRRIHAEQHGGKHKPSPASMAASRRVRLGFVIGD
jgi:hypothetical protein